MDPNLMAERMKAHASNTAVPEAIDVPENGTEVSFTTYVPEVGTMKLSGKVASVDGTVAHVALSENETMAIDVSGLEWLRPTAAKPMNELEKMSAAWEDGALVKKSDSNGNIEGRVDGYHVVNTAGASVSGPHATWSAAMDVSRDMPYSGADSTNSAGQIDSRDFFKSDAPTASKGDARPFERTAFNDAFGPGDKLEVL